MYLRTEPNKPKIFKNKRYQIDLDCDPTVAELLENLSEYGINPEDAVIEVETCYDSPEMFLSFMADESEKKYAKRLSDYKKALASYKKWYKENGEAAKVEIALRDKSTRKNKKEHIKTLEKRIVELKEDLNKE